MENIIMAETRQFKTEVQQLLQSCYEDAVRILTEHRSLLDEVASYLLVKETITGDELMAYVNAEAKPSEQ